MRRDDAIFLILDRRQTSDRFKMTKAKTAVFLVMIICSCGLIFSITDALPTPEPETGFEDDTRLGNNSRLVITHVVKTIEFEVGIVEDVPADENSTDTDPSQFYETDIQLLNVDLLKEVMNQATAEENWEGTMIPEQNSQQTANEEKADAQLQNASLPLYPPSS